MDLFERVKAQSHHWSHNINWIKYSMIGL